MIVPAASDALAAASPAAFVGIDWGSTRRRVCALDASGATLREFSDDEGMLRAAGAFASSLALALQRIGPLAAPSRVVMAGMVGSAQGWHEVPYLDTGVPLDALGGRLFRLSDGPAGADCRIVPGYCWRGDAGAVDVMRGEETQLLGAYALGHHDGWFVLPGTHSKWVRLRDGRIERFATHLTGELFALLTQHGTLAPLMRDAVTDDAAFARGLRSAGDAALTRTLFACRAQVVTRQLDAALARDHLSGVLIGTEWHDALKQLALDPAPLWVIGSSELAARYVRAAALLGVAATALDARVVQHAAWSWLQRAAAD